MSTPLLLLKVREEVSRRSAIDVAYYDEMIHGWRRSSTEGAIRYRWNTLVFYKRLRYLPRPRDWLLIVIPKSDGGSCAKKLNRYYPMVVRRLSLDGDATRGS